MAEYSGTSQTVQPGGSITYSIVDVPCSRGLVKHAGNSGNFLLRGVLQNGANSNGCCPRCRRGGRDSIYNVTVGANIAVAEGETVGEISIGIAVDGGVLQDSIMRVTPAAVGEFSNVKRTKSVDIFNGCCQTVTVVNTSTVAIDVEEPNIIFGVA